VDEGEYRFPSLHKYRCVKGHEWIDQTPLSFAFVNSDGGLRYQTKIICPFCLGAFLDTMGAVETVEKGPDFQGKMES